MQMYYKQEWFYERIDYVIIIGGGPAGLSAYYLAEYGFRTVLFERKSKGELAHPCGCMVAPVKGYITFENQQNGIYYKEADFLLKVGYLMKLSLKQNWW